MQKPKGKCTSKEPTLCHCEEARRSNLSQRWHQPQIASLAFAMTPQGQCHRPRTVSLRGGTTKQSRPAAAPTPDCFTSVRNDTQKPPQIASLAFAMTPKNQTRWLHFVRNDTPRATPPPSNRVIARRQRRSNLCQRWHLNQIASLSFAMTPKNHPRLLHSRSQ